MSWLDGLRHRLGDALAWRWRDEEFDEEVRLHIELETARLAERGLSRDAARARAVERFGNPRRIAQEIRDGRTFTGGETMQDLRWAMRSLMRSPGFTLVAGAVLALAIAASTAVYSVVNAALLRPLPYPNPGELVSITSVYRPDGAAPTDVNRVSLTEVELWRQAKPSTIESIGGFAYTQLPIRVGAQAFSPPTALVDPEFLGVIGVTPQRGTLYGKREDPGNRLTVVITHRLWRDAFSMDATVIGRTILVDGVPMRVRAVMPPDFQFPRGDASYYDKPVDLMLLSGDFEGFPANSRQWFGIARLRPDAGVARAAEDMASVARRVASVEPSHKDWTTSVTSLAQATRRSSRTALLVVLAIAAILLVIAAVNVMTLQLSRGAARLHAMTIRRAMGCSTGRLVRQLMLESACLTVGSGAVGLIVARVLSNVIVVLSPVYLPVTGHIGIDGSVVAFVFIVCLVTALVAGLLPALYAARSSEQAVRVSGLRVSAGRSFAAMQRSLCVAQIALGVALLSVASALVGHMLKLGGVDAGFRTDHAIGFSFSVPSDRSLAQRRDFYQAALDAVRSVRGVESAGLISFIPPEIRAGVFMPVRVDGDVAPRDSPRSANHLVTSPGYFETVGIRMAAGRRLEESDREGTTPVIVVNQAFVRRFFPDGIALGRSVAISFDGGVLRRIVGITQDFHDRGVDRTPTATVYIPFRQFALPYGSMVVRTTVDPLSLVPEIRGRVHRVDAAVPLVDFQLLTDRMHAALAEPRFYTYLATLCAGMALLFVTLGVFGIVSFSVSRRTSEFGIRMAIGASARTILAMVIRQAAIMAAAGAAIGLWLALFFGRVLSTLPFKVETPKSATLAAGIGIIAIVVLAAGYVPARRASRVSPLSALRHE